MRLSTLGPFSIKNRAEFLSYAKPLLCCGVLSGCLDRRINMSKICRALPLVTLLCLFFLPSVALAADSFIVYVGYADNLRPSGFFPTPWLGSPNVVSQTPSGQTLDTGAIRIDNTGANPITITGLTVKFNGGSPPLTRVFNIWNPLTINPGQVGIFTQTMSFNFDTSDFGIFGGSPPVPLSLPPSLRPSPTIPTNNQIGGCSSTPSILAASGFMAVCAANAPVVSFMENGNPFSFTDTGQILNTGGWDFANSGMFGGDGNESINWNVIGSQASRSGTTNFAAFCAELETSEEEEEAHKRFELELKFMLGKNSGGIDPPLDPITLQLGTFSTTFPAGSFTKKHSGKFVFEGQINGVEWEIHIASIGNNSFTFKARGKGVDLSTMMKPVTVTLLIGNDTGSTAAFSEEEEEKGEGNRNHSKE